MIEHISIVEGMKAIGATECGLINKNNKIIFFVLNVQSIAKNPQKLPSSTIDSILIYLTYLPDPLQFLQEVKRVLKPQGAIFLRDLLRPETPEIRDNLVELYAGNCNAHQQQLFSNSLQAAFTLDEVEEMIQNARLDGLRIYESSDRHWTAERAWTGLTQANYL